MSIHQLEQVDVVSTITSILEETNFPPSQLCIEITETAFMHNCKDNVHKLYKLRRAGIQIAIDDFGKGYSSMSYIQQLPVSKLKIDMSFIENISTDSKSAEIARVIILLSKTLGLTTVAEGVETREQVHTLREFGCDQIQGYFSGIPNNIKVFGTLIDYETDYISIPD
jgi:EAL domain-containing protein (putative c-di-GMP-specific phosphodiesterase class I)